MSLAQTRDICSKNLVQSKTTDVAVHDPMTLVVLVCLKHRHDALIRIFVCAFLQPESTASARQLFVDDVYRQGSWHFHCLAQLGWKGPPINWIARKRNLQPTPFLFIYLSSFVRVRFPYLGHCQASNHIVEGRPSAFHPSWSLFLFILFYVVLLSFYKRPPPRALSSFILPILLGFTSLP